MKYTAHTDETLNKLNLLTPGIHDFEVIETDDKPSAKGNDMITLKVNVFDEEGTPRIVFDYLGEFMPHKLKHAAEACGLANEYANGGLSHELFLNRTGKCEIATSPAKGEYLERSIIKDYVKPSDAPSARPVISKDLDDEIPF